MEVGIRTISVQRVNLVVVNNAVLQNSGLSLDLAAGQSVKGHLWFPFTVGASGGIQFLLNSVSPALRYNMSGNFCNTVTGTIVTGAVQTQVAFTNPVPNAGTHTVFIDFFITANLATQVNFQIAQATADANALTFLLGSTMDCIFV